MVRRLIALDETCVKVNGLEYWVYAALDVDRNEILSMRVYPSKVFFNSITSNPINIGREIQSYAGNYSHYIIII